MADSIAKLEKALRRDPDSPRFARLADLFLKRGHIERAIELCQKGCASFPDYATGFIVLSKCYEKQGNLEKAREAMGQALRIDPENPSGHKRLAHLFEQLGIAPQALQSLRQAAYFDPFDPSLAEQIDRFARQTHQEASEPEEATTVPNAAPVESEPKPEPEE
ncbi:MAG: tetratricopeptide repeat protein, partial [Gemmatimonadetes bacterium]|nr:tetratricopeptide repeat protein [Gemmatimonadota bacterium]